MGKKKKRVSAKKLERVKQMLSESKIERKEPTTGPYALYYDDKLWQEYCQSHNIKYEEQQTDIEDYKWVEDEVLGPIYTKVNNQNRRTKKSEGK